MVAFVATGVHPFYPLTPVVWDLLYLQIHAVLEDRAKQREGPRQRTDFSSTNFRGVYEYHLGLLADIKEENPRGYHTLMSRLYNEVAYVQPSLPASIPPLISFHLVSLHLQIKVMNVALLWPTSIFLQWTLTSSSSCITLSHNTTNMLLVMTTLRDFELLLA